MSERMKKIALVFILLIGGFFRFYHVNWDNFGAFHPDERNISWAVTRIHFFREMDPKFFAYGGLPIYLYRAIGEGAVFFTKNPVWLYDWGHIAVVGRYVSATLSTISIFLIFLVGSSYFSPSVGYLSAFLLAFSPWAIREAHFETTETMLVFFLLLLLYFAKKKKIVLLGIIWGLAMAAKTTALLFGVIPLLALGKKIHKTFFVGLIALVVFFSFSPYTILNYKSFRESMTYETGVALGRFTVPYTLQFLHTTPYVYQLTTMLWQAGPLVIIGLAGLIAMLIAIMPDLIRHPLDSRLRGNDNYKIVFLIFPLIYFSWQGMWFAKFARYNVPFLPFLTIAAAWLSIKLGKPFAVIICIITAFWGIANFTIYLRPQTKVTATNWILKNISPSAMIYTEHWNDGLPLDVPNASSYHRELLNVYDDPDDDTKRTYLTDKLVAGDYIILSTRRIWGTMPRLTERYPVTSVFYTKLLRGDLGYKEVATFTSYPQLFGIEINDDSAEESVSVFDHPTVRIFQNTERLSKEEISNRLVSSTGN